MIDINYDIGESFGDYKIGNDKEVISHIISANIACGFHASDLNVMAGTVQLCKEYGVMAGAPKSIIKEALSQTCSLDKTMLDIIRLQILRFGCRY